MERNASRTDHIITASGKYDQAISLSSSHLVLSHIHKLPFPNQRAVFTNPQAVFHTIMDWSYIENGMDLVLQNPVPSYPGPSLAPPPYENPPPYGNVIGQPMGMVNPLLPIQVAQPIQVGHQADIGAFERVRKAYTRVRNPAMQVIFHVSVAATTRCPCRLSPTPTSPKRSPLTPLHVRSPRSFAPFASFARPARRYALRTHPDALHTRPHALRATRTPYARGPHAIRTHAPARSPAPPTQTPSTPARSPRPLVRPARPLVRPTLLPAAPPARPNTLRTHPDTLQNRPLAPAPYVRTHAPPRSLARTPHAPPGCPIHPPASLKNNRQRFASLCVVAAEP
ncbi:hypothetical protein B0H12DRAFT_1240951 [Mycena haematopus]|nr:hypothetical protein B0H12DRAFT_1240951 [Mycena haematopus]